MADKQDIKLKILDNGTTLITEKMENIYSLSIGIWLKEGARDEDEKVIGISHFTEHMFFKGTKKRNALEIAKIIDALGGNIDAFTAKENMCFYGNFLEEHFPVAAELFSDLIINPRFDPVETEKERNVIIEEIKSIEDSPADLLFDLFIKYLWMDHPLGRPISGDMYSIAKITHKDIQQFFHYKFYPENMLITIAGSLDHDAVFALSNEYFGKFMAQKNAQIKRTPPMNYSFFKLIDKNQLEQVHITLGTLGYQGDSEQRYAYYLFNTILGGSMSSRLFQRIREEEGLAYSVQSLINSYLDTGFTAVYLATSKENAKKALALSCEEIVKMKNELVDQKELERAKQHIKGNLLLGLESSSNRMLNLAKQHIYFNKFISTEETIHGIESVTAEEIQAVANDLFKPEHIALAVLGNTENLDIDLNDIKWD